MTSLTLTVTAITLTYFIHISKSDTHVCNSTILSCEQSTINCINSEPCLIQCTADDGCVGTTVNCPTDSNCTIECDLDTNSNGCQNMVINAESSNSLSLVVESVARGFNASTIFCPLQGNCSLTGSGNNAYLGIQVYSLYGFAFDLVSIACSGNNNCISEATMHCGNGYAWSCLFDESSGDSCNSPDPCDTVFTSIAGRWDDDYVIGGAPGWVVTDYNGTSLNSVLNGSNSSKGVMYHGPFVGDVDSGTLEQFNMKQLFYCETASSVYVEYKYIFACHEAADYSAVRVDGQEVGRANAARSFGSNELMDDAISHYTFAERSCGTDTVSAELFVRGVNGSTESAIVGGTLFEVEIVMEMNFDNDVALVSGVSVVCVPVTGAPSAATDAPTVSPSVPPTVSSEAPSMLPSMVSESPTQTSGQDGGFQVGGGSAGSLDIVYATGTDLEGLLVAGLVIGGFCMLTVLAACYMWRKHEQAHLPFYKRRKEEILKQELQANHVELEEMEMHMRMSDVNKAGDGYNEYATGH